MLDLIIRCSALGSLMTEPQSIDIDQRTDEVLAIMAKTKRTDEEKAIIAAAKERSLSAGAKTAVRKLVRESIYGVEVEVDAKELEKGRRLEAEAISMVNRLRGLSLSKNTDRRSDGVITGECDLFNAAARRGHDTKVPWSIASFPIAAEDCEDQGYFWQAQGYMRLWDAVEWDIDYCLLTTPADLIRYEPIQLHVVDHIDEHHRLTTWTVRRDEEAQRLIPIKVDAARRYAMRIVREFDMAHQLRGSDVGHARPAAEQRQREEAEAQAAEAQRRATEQVAREGQEAAAKVMALLPGAVQSGAMEPDRAERIGGLVSSLASDAVIRGAQAAANEPATVKLGDLADTLGFPLRADFIEQVLGIKPAGRDSAAILYRPRQVPDIVSALQQHLARVQAGLSKAA